MKRPDNVDLRKASEVLAHAAARLGREALEWQAKAADPNLDDILDHLNAVEARRIASQTTELAVDVLEVRGWMREIWTRGNAWPPSVKAIVTATVELERQDRLAVPAVIAWFRWISKSRIGRRTAAKTYLEGRLASLKKTQPAVGVIVGVRQQERRS